MNTDLICPDIIWTNYVADTSDPSQYRGSIDLGCQFPDPGISSTPCSMPNPPAYIYNEQVPSFPIILKIRGNRDIQVYSYNSCSGNSMNYCNCTAGAGGCNTFAEGTFLAEWRYSFSYGKYWFFRLMAFRKLCFCSVIAAIAQLGERQTEDLKVPSSILGGGI